MKFSCTLSSTNPDASVFTTLGIFSLTHHIPEAKQLSKNNEKSPSRFVNSVPTTWYILEIISVDSRNTVYLTTQVPYSCKTAHSGATALCIAVEKTGSGITSGLS